MIIDEKTLEPMPIEIIGETEYAAETGEDIVIFFV